MIVARLRSFATRGAGLELVTSNRLGDRAFRAGLGEVTSVAMSSDCATKRGLADGTGQ